MSRVESPRMVRTFAHLCHGRAPLAHGLRWQERDIPYFERIGLSLGETLPCFRAHAVEGMQGIPLAPPDGKGGHTPPPQPRLTGTGGTGYAIIIRASPIAWGSLGN